MPDPVRDGLTGNITLGIAQETGATRLRAVAATEEEETQISPGAGES
jgi:hypothetical protein